MNTREVYVGNVTNNDDPERLGRIKVACASLMGVDANGSPREYPVWIPPRYPVTFSSDGSRATGGAIWTPDVGCVVEFEVTSGSTLDQSPGQSSIVNPNPRWLGAVTGPGDALHPELLKNYPLRRGIVSANGHFIIFDDSSAADGDRVIVRHRDGETEVVLEAGKATIKAGEVVVDSPDIKLGAAAAEQIVKGNTFQSLFNAHTHIGNLGAATGPPVVPLNGSELSDVSRTE